MLRTCSALLCSVALSQPLAAQIDYRNLDAGRPIPVEDAYTVERRAIEFGLGYGFERIAGRSLHIAHPEITWGLLANTQVELGAPLASLPGDNGTSGLAGLRASLLHNLFTESPSIPALSLRGDLHLPVGELGGDGARGTLSLLATRSFGYWRTHLNTGWGFSDPSVPAAVDALPRWHAGLALDRTIYRQSLLLAGSVTASRAAQESETEILAALGIRWQWSPVIVLDLGAFRRLSSHGPDLGLTIGLSRAFGTKWYAGRGTPSSPYRPDSTIGLPEGRNETMYYPGSFNWKFQKHYPEAARLFNAFDYGHAVLYQRLLDRREADRLLEQQDYPFLVNELLRHPPRFGVTEEAVAPDYARLAWKAKSMFDWAHLLHRQIYDIYSDWRLDDSTRIQLVERATDDYLANRSLAFTTAPKSMALMDSASYSLVFRERYPRFNGLIWAYHWLQVGLYEPMVTAKNVEDQRGGIALTLKEFWKMLDEAPASMPATMPMTAQVAPHFAARHPRATAIFDNLHMMHDIISDVLASDDIPMSRKRAEIYASLAEFQDASRNLAEPGHHH